MNTLPGDSNLAAGLSQRDIDRAYDGYGGRHPVGDAEKHERELERAENDTASVRTERPEPAPLDYPNEAGPWWAWADHAKRWYLIHINDDDLDDNNVPTSYAWWTKCVPPPPPNK